LIERRAETVFGAPHAAVPDSSTAPLRTLPTRFAQRRAKTQHIFQLHKQIHSA
jgi:hypothetical protein